MAAALLAALTLFASLPTGGAQVADPVSDLADLDRVLERLPHIDGVRIECNPSSLSITSTGPVADRVGVIAIQPDTDVPLDGNSLPDAWNPAILDQLLDQDTTLDLYHPIRLSYEGSVPGPTAIELNLGLGRSLRYERIDAPTVITTHNDAGPLHRWTADSLTGGLHRVSYRAITSCDDGGGQDELIDIDYFQWDSRQRCMGSQSAVAVDRNVDLATTPELRRVVIDDPGLPKSLKDLLSSTGSDSATTPAAPDPTQTHRYLIGTHTTPTRNVGDPLYGGVIVERNLDLRFYTVEFPATSTTAFFAQAAEDIDVRYCDPDGLVHALLTPNDASFGSQYAHQNINSEAAWSQVGSYGTTGKNVCVIDTGIRSTHQDLAGPRYLGGTDFTGTGSNWDDHGHGTHVSGIAVGNTNNAIGIAGEAQANHLSVKVLTGGGSGTWGWLADGIEWCADNGGDIISMSLGGSSAPTAVSDAVDYADGLGKLMIAAAGNSGCSGCVGYPAAYPKVMAVSCTDSADAICSFSSTGPEVEIAAPGYNILSSCNSSDSAYCSMSGTSMSTPYVSGAAALVWNAVPSLTASQVRNFLRCGAEDFGASGWDSQYGDGRLDVYASAYKAMAGSCSASPCSGQILVFNAPNTGGTYTQADLKVTHSPASAHVVSWTFTASDGVTIFSYNLGHDEKHIYAGDSNTRTVTVTATLACGTVLTESFLMYN